MAAKTTVALFWKKEVNAGQLQSLRRLVVAAVCAKRQGGPETECTKCMQQQRDAHARTAEVGGPPG